MKTFNSILCRLQFSLKLLNCFTSTLFGQFLHLDVKWMCILYLLSGSSGSRILYGSSGSPSKIDEFYFQVRRDWRLSEKKSFWASVISQVSVDFFLRSFRNSHLCLQSKVAWNLFMRYCFLAKFYSCTHVHCRSLVTWLTFQGTRFL